MCTLTLHFTHALNRPNSLSPMLAIPPLSTCARLYLSLLMPYLLTLRTKSSRQTCLKHIWHLIWQAVCLEVSVILTLLNKLRNKYDLKYEKTHYNSLSQLKNYRNHNSVAKQLRNIGLSLNEVQSQMHISNLLCSHLSQTNMPQSLSHAHTLDWPTPSLCTWAPLSFFVQPYLDKVVVNNLTFL